MEQLPRIIYLDREDLMEDDMVDVVDASHPNATKYVSVERLWYDGTEEPEHGRKVVAEFADGLDYREAYIAARYDAKARLFFAEMGIYKPQHIKRWTYIDELV